VRRTWRSIPGLLLSVVLVMGCQPAASPSTAPHSTPFGTAGASPPPATPPHESQSPGAAGVVAEIGRLHLTRAAHTATLLPDGRLLIAGGCVQDSCEGITATTELLDPATGATTPGPNMLQRRVSHVAVPLSAGRVLMIGGFQEGTVLDSTEIYDPAANAFSAGPDLLEPLADPVVFVLGDGSTLVAGGYSGGASLATAELLDPPLKAFRSTGAMSTARSAHGGAMLADGRVIVIGGNSRGDVGTVLATAEIYDPETGTWTATGDMTAPRHKLAAVALADGRVLVVGGSNQQDAFGQYKTAEIYDPASRTFAPTGDMAARRYKISGSVVRLDDGRVLVAGGSRRAEVFDPASASFQLVGGEANTTFNFSTASLLPDGSVLVCGGYNSGIHLTDQVLRFVP
jgi:Kelch motif/Galactose oxidase, central domain